MSVTLQTDSDTFSVLRELPERVEGSAQVGLANWDPLRRLIRPIDWFSPGFCEI